MNKIEQLVESARKTLRVMTWTPSRFAKWKECPRKVLFEDLMKMCPKCFVGKISGGFDGEPVVCDSCDQPQPAREALDRGNKLDDCLTSRLGTVKKPAAPPTDDQVADDQVADERAVYAEATRHPGVAEMVKKLAKTKNKSTQESIVLDSGWNRVSQFTKNAWARLKLDVLVLRPKIAEVLDWKSGNIDKTTKEIRERPEYHESMRMYQAAVLSVFPQPEASATMVFLDTPPKSAVFTKSLPVLKRKDLEAAREDIERKVAPMFKDDLFAPRPGYYCNWCPFSKKAGGPCPY